MSEFLIVSQPATDDYRNNFDEVFAMQNFLRELKILDKEKEKHKTLNEESISFHMQYQAYLLMNKTLLSIKTHTPIVTALLDLLNPRWFHIVADDKDKIKRTFLSELKSDRFFDIEDFFSMAKIVSLGKKAKENEL